MSDPASSLRTKFALPNRYSNFGPVLRAIRIDGFRGIDDLLIQAEYPLTVFSGLNGSGKSTVDQLAVCAYKKPSTAISYKRYYVKDFFPVSVADPSPFAPNASVRYTYETDQPVTPQDVTISRAKAEWSGYKRQPERHCYYVGFTLYVPKVERRDLSVYQGAQVELRQVRAIPESARNIVASILGEPYQDLHFQAIGHRKREVELGMAMKHGRQYSENNMGFGEGRILYMVDLLENSPEQSLFVLEEPETSLHEEAQHKLARYLVDVCDRRHHQLLMSSHSAVILEALPSEARILLFRDKHGVTQYSGISSTRARAILSGGHVRALTICVEDEFAKLMTVEILRKAEPSLLKAVAVEPIGSKNAVRDAVRLLTRIGHKALGLRDPDAGANPLEMLYSLPGSKPPEVEVFGSPKVAEELLNSYGLDLSQFMQAHQGLDHHDVAEAIAHEVEAPVEAISMSMVRQYVNGLDPSTYHDIVKTIREAA